MARIWVEAWSPEYGASYEVAGGLAQSEEEVAPEIERVIEDWQPISPPDAALPDCAFLDGVSRIEARAFVERSGGAVPGICGSVGVGVTLLNGRASFGPSSISRTAVFGEGVEAAMPPIQGLDYASHCVPGSRPEELNDGLQAVRAEQEDRLAQRVARDGWLVIADGPARVREDLPVVGVIKSHQKAYLPPALEGVVRSLGRGERTPVFMFGVIRPRYSWYLRLIDQGMGHPWSGVVRCEVSKLVGERRALELADLVSRHLPRFASKPHWDPRAPQNLVPIASLERRLHHLLGDRDLIYRRIRSSLQRSREQDV